MFFLIPGCYKTAFRFLCESRDKLAETMSDSKSLDLPKTSKQRGRI